MLKKATSGVRALLDGLFEHPVGFPHLGCSPNPALESPEKLFSAAC